MFMENAIALVIRATTTKMMNTRGPTFVRVFCRFLRRNNRALGPCAFIVDPNSPLKAVVPDKDVNFLARAQPNQMARMRPDQKP
jgi:hypothetical protein